MNCEIISVGTELLTGSVLNTNTQFLTKALSEIGISVRKHVTVGDNPKKLEKALTEALEDNKLIILTGGLGPTQDDLTKNIVAEVLEDELVENADVKASIISFFENHNHLTLTENNFQQALVPKNGDYIPNTIGTAPGLIFYKDEKIIILLPGPPHELKKMFNEAVKPLLESLNNVHIVNRYYNLTGIGESAAEDKILDIVKEQNDPTIATYAKPGEVLIRLTTTSENSEVVLDEAEKVLKERLGEFIFAYSDDSLLLTVGKYLIKNKLTISSAESCTGGLISATFTDIPGISESFMLGLVTYDNKAKEKVLGVKKETLEKFGAVSEETCREMCENVRNILNTDIGVATTGIAGPGGGTKEKPVGLVYTGIALRDKTVIQKNIFSGDRETVRRRAVNMIFQMIRKELFTTYEEDK